MLLYPLMFETSASRARPEWRVLLAVLGLFLFTVPGLLAVIANQTLFNPQVYKEELARLDFYQRYPEILGESLAQSSDKLLPGLGVRLLGTLNAGNYQDLVRLLLPPDWVKAQAESLIDQFWAYYNFETPALHLVVDFSSVKTRLQNEPDLRVVQILVQSLPVCTDQDLLNFGLLMLQGKLDEAPLCRPPDQFIGVTNTLVTELLRGAGSLAPGQVDLAALLSPPAALLSAQPAGPGLAFAMYRGFRTAGPWLLLGTLACLGAVVVWGRGTARGAVFWSGAGLLLPGFAALLTALILALGSSQIAPLLVQRVFLADLPVFEVLVRLVQAVGSRFFLWLGAAGLGLSIIGTALIVVDYFVYERASRSKSLE
jgi:hypothetical protein